MFQTASLYSIEVDYYHFGTCEITGGSYFCGDHSCNTYKYVGATDQQKLMEQKFIEPDLYYPTYKTNSPTSTSDAYIYTHGLGNVNGPNDPSSNPPLEHGTYVQPEKSIISGKPSGYPLRMDAQLPQYYLHDGRKASAVLTTFANASGIDMWQYKVNIIKWHARHTVLAGQCKGRCDADETCKAFNENRYGYLHASIKCTTYHFNGWLSEFPGSVAAATVPSDEWDFYEKYTNTKAKTWLHVPKSSAFSPTTSGRRLDGVY